MTQATPLLARILPSDKEGNPTPRSFYQGAEELGRLKRLLKKRKKHLQKLRRGQKVSSSQVHWVSEHEEEIKVSNEISDKLVDDPADRKPRV